MAKSSTRGKAATTKADKPGAKQPSDRKPNILVIWGDDIGISNLSCYSHGLMGYQTPNIDRVAKEGMMFTDSYGEQSCTAGRSSFITGQSVYRTGLVEGRHSGRADRHVRQDRHDRRAAQGAGLRDRPVRQEPSRRSKRRCCRPTMVSTSSSATSITSTRRKSRRCTTTRRIRGSTRTSDRAGVIHSWATDKDDKTGHAAVGQGRQAEDQRHGSADQEADGDLRRRVRRRRERLRQASDTRATSRSSCGSTPRTCTYSRTPRRRASARRGNGNRRTTTRWSTTTRMSVRCSTCSTISASPRTRSCMYSTDNGPHMNTWPDGAHDAVPQREEHQLGRRFPHSVVGALARQDRGGQSISNEIVQHHDWLPTFLAMAGDTGRASRS